MTYNCLPEICGAIVSIATLFILYTQYEEQSHRSKLYMGLVWTVLSACIIDCLSAYGFNHLTTTPLWFNILADVLYYSTAPVTIYLCVEYFFAGLNKFPRALRYFNIVIIGIFEALTLISIPTGIVFKFTETEYIHGPLYWISTALLVYFVLNIPFLTLINRKELSRKKQASCMGFCVISALGFLLQTFVFTGILMTYFFISVATLIIMWTMETPDFKALKQLQDHLQEEVKNQTEIATSRQRKIENMSIQLIDALVHSIDAKDAYTNGHSTRVSEYAQLLARELGWPEEKVESVRHAALLHDIGKIGIPDAILNKPGRLTNEEFDVMKQHTVIGAKIMENVTSVIYGMDVAHYHHERYGGHGYPEGLAGEEIPEVARLVCIADSYDAMSSRRVYRRNLKREDIRGELVRGRGSQFDPEMMDVFLKLFDEDRLVIEHPPVMPDWVLKEEEDQSEVDELTGLIKRSAGEHLIQETMRTTPGALICMDMDDLQLLNSIRGFVAGDEVLRCMTRILREQLPGAILCRFGGDEFLVYLPDKELGEAREKILGVIGEFKKQGFGQEIQVTVSAGMAMAQLGDSYEDIYQRADKSLFYIKKTGKADLYVYDQGFIQGANAHNDIDLKKFVEQLASGIAPQIEQMENRKYRQMMEHLIGMHERYDYQFCIVMITLQEENDNYLDEIEQAMFCMEHAIRVSIRRVDMFTRYSNMQFLITLQNINEERGRKVVERIFHRFYSDAGTHGIVPNYALEVIDSQKQDKDI